MCKENATLIEYESIQYNIRCIKVLNLEGTTMYIGCFY